MLRIVALLYAGPTGADGLRAYERRVLPILCEHGGRVVMAFTPDEPGPDEVHVLEFPSAAAFAAYRADERIAALAAERSAAIARTELYSAERLIDYD